MKVFVNPLKHKLLLVIVAALLCAVSFTYSGQAVNAAEAAAIDPDHLQDGNYYIDYTVLYADQDKTSMSTQYLVSPALLKVQDNKKTVSFTVLQSKEIVGIKLNDKNGIVSENNTDNNTRVVTFEVEQLTEIQPAWISINWVIEAIDFKYIHEYDIRFKFLPETLKAVAADAPVPTKDGKVGFPSGLNEESSEPGNSGNENGGTSEESNPEQQNGEQPAAEAGFTDVEGHWAKAVIERAVQLSIADGYSDGTFKPNAVINRSQFAVLLSRALKLPEAESASTFADQKDIPAWAAEHIQSAVAAGLMGGYSDGTFRGSNNITRTEMAVIIARAAKLNTEQAASLNFADTANIPAWAKQEVAAAVQAGLVSGKSNNRFEPAASATRAEALTIIMRLLDAKQQ